VTSETYIKLKDCCTVVGGATPKRNIPEYWGNDVPWVTPKDVSKMEAPVLDDAPEYISNKGFDSCSTYMLPKGSILFTSRAPIGNVAIAGREMCTNQGFKSLIPGSGVDSSYLYHCMKYMSQKIQDLGNGATFKEVSKKIIEEFKIPLPPLKEQKRIAEILDKADAIRRKRQQAIDLTDQLLRSVFLDMFGDHDVIKMKLEDAMEEFIDYRGKTPPKVESGIPLVTAKVIKNGRIETPKEFIAEDFYDEWMSRGLPKVGDLLFTTEAPLGKTALVDDANIALAQRVLLMRGKPGLLDNTFLMHAIKSQAVWDEILRRSSGSTVKGIRQKELRQVMIPVPDMVLQKKFSSFAHKHEKSRKKVISNKDEISILFDALTQQAFNGELTKQIKAA